MNKTIWKYEFKTNSLVNIEMPIGAEILTVQSQQDKTCFWALVDPKAKLKQRCFEIIGTGHTIWEQQGQAERKYIGTYQLHGGDLVFHVFEYKA